MFITGTVMAFIRFYDPLYRHLVIKGIYELFGEIIEEPKSGIKAEILSTFLSSSLNIELVYIILAGITRFSNSSGYE